MNTQELQEKLIEQVKEYFVQNGVKFGQDQCAREIPNISNDLLMLHPDEKFFVLGVALRDRRPGICIELEIYRYDENGKKKQDHSIFSRTFLSNYLFTL